jgi:hypothetical protein
MASHSHVESILATDLGKVLVGANTTGFEGFGGQLLILVGDQMHAERELVDTCFLTAQVKDTDLKTSTWAGKKKNEGEIWTFESGTPRL